MTRGNQREKDRERAAARAKQITKPNTKDDGLTPDQRRERDAKALQEKTAKKLTEKEKAEKEKGEKEKAEKAKAAQANAQTSAKPKK